MLSIASAPDEIALCGVFVENLTYAATAARVGFDALIGHKVCDDEAQIIAANAAVMEKRG